MQVKMRSAIRRDAPTHLWDWCRYMKFWFRDDLLPLYASTRIHWPFCMSPVDKDKSCSACGYWLSKSVQKSLTRDSLISDVMKRGNMPYVKASRIVDDALHDMDIALAAPVKKMLQTFPHGSEPSSFWSGILRSVMLTIMLACDGLKPESMDYVRSVVLDVYHAYQQREYASANDGLRQARSCNERLHAWIIMMRGVTARFCETFVDGKLTLAGVHLLCSKFLIYVDDAKKEVVMFVPRNLTDKVRLGLADKNAPIQATNISAIDGLVRLRVVMTSDDRTVLALMGRDSYTSISDLYSSVVLKQ